MSEFSDQCAVIAWARLNERRYPCLKWVHASLNGVKLTVGQARKAKAAGMTSGIPDLFLPYPNAGYAGLYVEMKSKHNKTTPNQDEFLAFAKKNGYWTCIARGPEEAISMIEEYVNWVTGAE